MENPPPSLARAGDTAPGDADGADRFVLNGGLLVALWFDLALRSAKPASDLDEWMRAYNNDPRRRERAPILTAFLDAVEAAAGLDVRRDLARLVTEPGAMDPARLFDGTGFPPPADQADRFALPAGPWDEPARPLLMSGDA